MRFLIDECLSPALVTVAHSKGFEAYHVAHRGWASATDARIVKHLIDEELILVTNNRDDFLALLKDTELHPGLVVIVENVRRPLQAKLFGLVLDRIGPMASLTNKVVEVDTGGEVELYDLPAL